MAFEDVSVTVLAIGNVAKDTDIHRESGWDERDPRFDNGTGRVARATQRWTMSDTRGTLR